MAEIMTYDSTNDSVVMESINADEAESLAIGEEMMAQQEQLLAGKYKNAEDLEAAYLELQKKLGSGEKEATQSEETEEAPETPEETEDSAVDFLWKVNDEYAKNNGQLSEETMEEFSKMSSKELVEAYFRYQNTVEQAPAPQGVELSDEQVNQVQNYVGGAEKYQELVSWAADNFSEEEITAFDSVVETGNIPAIKLALQSLQYRYQDKMGFEGNMLQGKAAQSRDVFRSQAELVRAMSDPRYDQDPAYRQEIMAKLDRSDLNF
jgi:hypothetical protein